MSSPTNAPIGLSPSEVSSSALNAYEAAHGVHDAYSYSNGAQRRYNSWLHACNSTTGISGITCVANDVYPNCTSVKYFLEPHSVNSKTIPNGWVVYTDTADRYAACAAKLASEPSDAKEFYIQRNNDHLYCYYTTSSSIDGYFKVWRDPSNSSKYTWVESDVVGAQVAELCIIKT